MTEHDTGRTPTDQLHELLLESQDITSFLHTLTATIARALSTDGDEVWCAVTLLRPKRSTTVASSSPTAEALDEIQYHYGDGPCLTAAREHRLVHVPDTRTDPRWPEYGRAAAAHGILSALGVPLELAAEAAAGLNVYADRPTSSTRRPSRSSSARWLLPRPRCAWPCGWTSTGTPRRT